MQPTQGSVKLLLLSLSFLGSFYGSEASWFPLTSSGPVRTAAPMRRHLTASDTMVPPENGPLTTTAPFEAPGRRLLAYKRRLEEKTTAAVAAKTLARNLVKELHEQLHANGGPGGERIGEPLEAPTVTKEQEQLAGVVSESVQTSELDNLMNDAEPAKATDEEEDSATMENLHQQLVKLEKETKVAAEPAKDAQKPAAVAAAKPVQPTADLFESELAMLRSIAAAAKSVSTPAARAVIAAAEAAAKELGPKA